MAYIIKIYSSSKWSGTQSDMGDTNKTFETKAEAEAEKARLDNDTEFQDQIWDEACQDQGVEAFTMVEEVE